MPIFMDRHDLTGTTAAEIAEAHRRDLAIQDRYGVKFLTYWFDEQRGTTFCLVEAPDKETAQCVHRAGAWLTWPERSSRWRCPPWRRFSAAFMMPEPPFGQSPADQDSGHRAIMFTDIVGSTKMTARLGDRMATELVRAHDSIVRRCLNAIRRSRGEAYRRRHHGSLRRARRRPLIAPSPFNRDFEWYNFGNAEPIHIRIGLDSGEPVEDSNDLFGATVQRAARLCSSASVDQILASENICREYGGDGIFVQVKPRGLKGFSHPVLAFDCAWSSLRRTA